MVQGISEVMLFVADRRLTAEWYSALMRSPILSLEDPEHFYLRIGDHEIWFHMADEKNPVGPAGQVAYWRVDDFDAMSVQATSLGATLYRGPLDRNDGSWMCQMRDPFGNVFGLVGRRALSG